MMQVELTLPPDYQPASAKMPGSDTWVGPDSSLLILLRAPRAILTATRGRRPVEGECAGQLLGSPARVVFASDLLPRSGTDSLYLWAAHLQDDSPQPLTVLIFARSRAARDSLSAAATRGSRQAP